ncbi:hypothetical protein [Pelagicoccus sp. SDUM812003]|uniref:hypothetical protein n=1 Tax=Pelagicoccus sp. SDUM812003 TaxID=3041267 RepID=UPI00280FEA18|nr:hypothetical protein [Pelagicoccus sp. SDUM812003]MDQ8204920.1 hypothetical protein [Pelagicoccus sp. SDUM812003]
MLETFLFLYGISLIAGSWLMLNGMAEAPFGYEDEDGFHVVPAPVASQSSEDLELDSERS